MHPVTSVREHKSGRGHDYADEKTSCTQSSGSGGNNSFRMLSQDSLECTILKDKILLWFSNNIKVEKSFILWKCLSINFIKIN